jgi:plasmid stability protein
MADLLIRNIDPDLKSRIRERAQEHGRSLSDETKLLIRKGLGAPDPEMKMGDWLYSLVRPEDRGDDLVFERSDELAKPPDFE